MYMYIYVLFFEFAVSRALLVVETQALPYNSDWSFVNKSSNSNEIRKSISLRI